MKTLMPTTSPAHRSQQGLSLVELMVSLTIGLILLAGVTSLIVQQNSARDELEKTSRQIENGRYAMQLLHDDIQHAGYYGQYFNPPAPTTTATPAGLPDPCSTSLTDIEAALSLPIQAYLNTLPTSSFTCALDGVSSGNNAQNYKAGTDILVIRRTGTIPATVGSLVPGLVYLQSTPAAHILGTGSSPGAFTLSNINLSGINTASLLAFETRIYFISPCSIPAGGGASCTGANDDNGHPIPTLKRLDMSATPGGVTTFTLTPLVEGIENMQLDFGIDNDPASPNGYGPDQVGDGSPDSYAAPATTTDWFHVMAIRVNLLARNTECSAGPADNKTYNLGLTAGNVPAPASDCTNGDYKRHVFTELIRAINPSGRREQ